MATFSAQRARSYVLRLPLFTRVIVGIILVVWVAGLQSAWNIRQWGALIPSKTNIKTLYRTNTYVFIHSGFFHMAINLISLTPLLERFEAEHGTLTSLALFIGPLSTFPAFLYIVLEDFVLHFNTPVSGASVWVFLLIAVDAIHISRTHPSFVVLAYQIPTWTTPIVALIATAALIPRSSFLGHLCGIAIGYLFGLGYLKFLCPPERALRWAEGKLNLLGRLPHYVSVDQKTYGRFGVLPTSHGQGAGLALSPMGVGPLNLGAGPINLGANGTGPDRAPFSGVGHRLGP